MRKTSAYARRRWAPDPLASLRLLDRARPFDEGDTTGEHIKTRACFERLAAVRKRHDKWAKWEVLPAERAAIVEALDAHEAITDASSPLQMYEALDVVRRSVILNMRKAA